MNKPSGPRKTANLSESIHHQLNVYAISATAAGVSLLALVQPSEAKIAYTSAHAKLPINAHFYLDLNHDGVKDFGFYLRSASFPPTGTHSTYDSLRVTGQQKNEVWAIRSNSSRLCAAALPKGTQVGPKAPFHKGALLMFAFAQSVGGGAASFCPWGGGVQYLGLKFLIKGKIHFGWARLGNFVFYRKPAATLTGYAYETIPNRPIVTGKTKGTDDEGGLEQPTASLAMPTPEPATLGALAMGAPGLSIWRRKETALQGN
jgi:hypothetical protein